MSVSFSIPTTPTSPFSQRDPQILPIPPAFTQMWGVYGAADNQPVFDIDSCVSVKIGNNAKVSGFPVEEGAFASYNKVGTPMQPKIVVAVGGQTRIAKFLDAVATELDSINLYNIVTPEASYYNLTLEKYDYSRTQKAGKNLIHAELTFMEVIQVSTAYSSVSIVRPKKAGAGDKHGDGKKQPEPLNIYQEQNAMDAKYNKPPHWTQKADGSWTKSGNY